MATPGLASWISQREQTHQASSAAAESDSAAQPNVTVLSSKFSPDGQWHVAASRGGYINIRQVKGPSFRPGTQPDLAWRADSGPIYSLQFAGDLLLAAGNEGISGWRWSDLVASMSGGKGAAGIQRVLRLESPQEQGARGALMGRSEVNGLSVSPSGAVVHAASGDSNLYSWDLSTEQVVRTFQGHQKTVHCVTRNDEDGLCSGSEDGSVRLWDVRSGKCTSVLDPESGQVCNFDDKWSSRPWIGCMAVDDHASWMVCGGGGRNLSLWHLPSRRVTATMPTASTPQACIFSGDDRILSVGNDCHVYHWRRRGKLAGRTKASSRSLYSVSVCPHAKPGADGDIRPLLAVTGTSRCVDVFTDPTASAYQLQFNEF